MTMTGIFHNAGGVGNSTEYHEDWNETPPPEDPELAARIECIIAENTVPNTTGESSAAASPTKNQTRSQNTTTQPTTANAQQDAAGAGPSNTTPGSSLSLPFGGSESNCDCSLHDFRIELNNAQGRVEVKPSGGAGLAGVEDDRTEVYRNGGIVIYATRAGNT